MDLSRDPHGISVLTRQGLPSRRALWRGAAAILLACAAGGLAAYAGARPDTIVFPFRIPGMMTRVGWALA